VHEGLGESHGWGVQRLEVGMISARAIPNRSIYGFPSFLSFSWSLIWVFLNVAYLFAKRWGLRHRPCFVAIKCSICRLQETSDPKPGQAEKEHSLNPKNHPQPPCSNARKVAIHKSRNPPLAGQVLEEVTRCPGPARNRVRF